MPKITDNNDVKTQAYLGGEEALVITPGGKLARVPFETLRSDTKNYQTKSEMDAAGAPANGQMAKVWNDPTEENNGEYGWSGAEWIKNKYDLFSQIRISESTLSIIQVGNAINTFKSLQFNQMYVSGGGDDEAAIERVDTESGYRGHAFKTVEAALNAAYPGDTITVMPGAYTWNNTGHLCAGVVVNCLPGVTFYNPRLVVKNASGAKITGQPDFITTEGSNWQIEIDNSSVDFDLGDVLQLNYSGTHSILAYNGSKGLIRAKNMKCFAGNVVRAIGTNTEIDVVAEYIHKENPSESYASSNAGTIASLDGAQVNVDSKKVVNVNNQVFTIGYNASPTEPLELVKSGIKFTGKETESGRETVRLLGWNGGENGNIENNLVLIGSQIHRQGSGTVFSSSGNGGNAVSKLVVAGVVFTNLADSLFTTTVGNLTAEAGV